MAILDYSEHPIFGGATVTMGLVANAWAFRSPLTGAVQTIGMPGTRWKMRISWDNTVLTPAEAGIVKAGLAKLRGMANRVRVWNLAHPAPRGTALGNPYVFGAEQAGGQLVTAGWSASSTGLLLPGDMIGIGGELKMVTERVDSDANGRATIQFEPELRAAPSNGSPVVLARPTAVFMSSQNESSWIELPGKRLRAPVLELIEDLRI